MQRVRLDAVVKEESMEKFIPYEKLSKKEKRRLDLSRRTTWGNLNPVTRKPASSKAYNRAKARSSSSGL